MSTGCVSLVSNPSEKAWCSGGKAGQLAVVCVWVQHQRETVQRGTIEKVGRINIEVEIMSGQQAANENGQGEGWGGDFWCRVRSVFSGQGLRWRSALVAPFIYMREETRKPYCC